MSGFIEGEDRNQATLFPERIDDDIAEDSAVCDLASRREMPENKVVAEHYTHGSVF